MNRLTKTLIATATAASLLLMGACCSGGGKKASAPQHLTISWWGNQTRNDKMKKIDDKFVKENKGVTIDGQFFEFSDYYQKISVSAAGKTMPDIMQIELTHFEPFKSNGLLMDMGKYIQDGTIDVSHVDKKVVNQGKLDGKMYGLTNAINAPALIYNKTLTDSLGITIPNDMTVEQFEDISRDIYKKSGYKTNFRYYEPSDELAYMLRAKGKVLFEKGKLGVKSPTELEPYFKVFEDGIKEGWHLDPKVFAELKIMSTEQDPLVYGTDPSRKSWCAFRWSSVLVASQAVAPKDVELALAPWPSANVAKSDYLKPSQLWVISKNCKNPDLAAKWINYYTNNEEVNKIMLTDRGLPINTKMVEAIKPNLTEPDKKSIDFVQKVVAPHSTDINPPAPAGGTEVDTKILPAIQENLCYGKISAKEAAQQFFDESNQALARAAK